MIARELLVKLGFDIDSAKLDKFNTSIDNTKKKMQSIRSGGLKSISSIAPQTTARFSAIRSYNDELASLSKKEKAEILYLNKIENQAIKETTRVEKSELKSRQSSIRDQFREKQLLQKTELSSMLSIGRKVAIAGAALTAGFGLSLRATLKDVANFKDGKKTSSIFDKRQIAAVDNFNKSLGSIKSTATELRNSFVIDMLPAIKDTLDIFNNWVKKNKVLIQEKLKNIVDGLTVAFEILSTVVGRVISIFDFAISKTIGWKAVIAAIITIGATAWFVSLANSIAKAAASFRIFSLALLSNPIILVVTGIVTAFGLLADEIYVTMKGGNSFINDFLKSNAWQTAKDSINAITASLKGMLVAMGLAQKTEFALRDKKKSLLNIENGKGKFGEGNVKAYSLEKNMLQAPFKPKPRLVPLSFPEFNPFDSLRQSIGSNRQDNQVNNKNSFVFNLTLPSGTTENQARDLTNLVKKELEKYTSYQNEKNLAAVGAY